MKEDRLKFGEAVEKLKEGYKVAREGWNGKGMFLYYVPAQKYKPTTEVAKELLNGEDVPYRDYIAMKTVDNEIVPWVASQSDVLVEDWVVVGGRDKKLSSLGRTMNEILELIEYWERIEKVYIRSEEYYNDSEAIETRGKIAGLRKEIEEVAE